MGEFDRAVKQLLEQEVVCPQCGERNVDQKRPITVERGQADCATCGHGWAVKQER